MNIPYFVKRNSFHMRCVCGETIFLGNNDTSEIRHGYCKCGLSWKQQKNRQYANPTVLELSNN